MKELCITKDCVIQEKNNEETSHDDMITDSTPDVQSESESYGQESETTSQEEGKLSNTSSQHHDSILEKLKSGDANTKDSLHLQHTNSTLGNLLPEKNLLPAKHLSTKLINPKVRSFKKHLFVELGTYKMSKFDLDNKSSSSSDSLNEIDLL